MSHRQRLNRRGAQPFRTIAAMIAIAGAPIAAANPSVPAAAAPPVAFVSCPIYRNTDQGPKSGCWLADDLESGVRYDIGGGRTKPQIGRAVLVEGVPAADANLCGGIVLRPVHTSPLKSTCPAVMLPAERFPGRAFKLPKGHVLPPSDVIRPLPAGPFSNKTWSIEFDFGSNFLSYEYSEVILDAAARYVRASHPRRVIVVGYAATAPYVVSGTRFVESPRLAEARAKMVALALRRLGVDPAIMRVRWHGKPRPADIEDGLAEPSKRRVTIAVMMDRVHPGARSTAAR